MKSNGTLKTVKVLLAAVRDLLILILPAFMARLLIKRGDYVFVILAIWMTYQESMPSLNISILK